MSEKITINRGTVQETLVFPVFGRKVANEKYPSVFRDTKARQIMEKVDYDFTKADMGNGGIPCLVYGMRQEELVKAAKRFLDAYCPCPAIL